MDVDGDDVGIVFMYKCNTYTRCRAHTLRVVHGCMLSNFAQQQQQHGQNAPVCVRAFGRTSMYL